MSPHDLFEAIASSPSHRAFVEENLLARVPWIFQGDATLFNAWRAAAAREVHIARENVFLVGSAATGFSLSPSKPGKDFRRAVSGASYRPSDLDIAIVDSTFFQEAWNTIVRFDRGRGLGSIPSGSIWIQRV